jgi:hypothetical protein
VKEVNVDMELVAREHVLIEDLEGDDVMLKRSFSWLDI